jgi:competence protein ComEC
MLAQPLPVLAVSLLLGSLAGAAVSNFPSSILLAAGVLLGSLFFLTVTRRCQPVFACLIFGLFLCGIVAAALTVSRSPHPSIPSWTGSQKIDLIGEIAEPVRYGPQRAAAIVLLRRLLTHDESISVGGRIKLTIRGNAPSLIVGDVIRFQTRLRAPRGLLNSGGVDYGAYLVAHGIQAMGSVTLGADSAGMQVMAHASRPFFDRVDSWRGHIREAARRGLDKEGAAVYLALITGESGFLTHEIRDAFMASGTTHILSISGSHLGLIGAVVFWVVRRSTLALPSHWLLRLTLRTTPSRIAAYATIPVVIFYALLGGAEVATVRSLLMLGVFLGGVLLGRMHHLGTALALAALLIVAWDPLAPLDLSFQLSVLSVLVIALLLNRNDPAPMNMASAKTVPERNVETRTGPLLDSISQPSRGAHDTVMKRLREVGLVGLGVTVVTAPLVAMQFHQIAWIGLFANLVVVPVVGLLLVPLGLFCCLLTLITGSENLQGVGLLQLSLDAVLSIVHGFASIPGARWMVASPPVTQVLLFYLCLAVGIFWRDRLKGRVAAALAFGLFALWVWSPRDLPMEGATRVTFLDVGQGDAAVIETPDDRVILIDGGGASEWSDQGRMVIAPFLWDRGIRRVDLIIATHPQLDHIGGLGYIVQEFPIGTVWTNGVKRDLPLVERLDEIVKERRIPVRAVARLDPPFPLGFCTIHILNPAAPTPSIRPLEPLKGKHLNNESVVLRLVCGDMAILFTGDIEQEAEAGLMGSADLRATVLKVPHHGSRSSLHEPFLRAVHPDVAIISVGNANPYGHPAGAMLDLYERLKISILRTDRDGAVTVMLTHSGLRVSCEAERRMKSVQGGNWGEEGENLRRLFSPSVPCRTAGDP